MENEAKLLIVSMLEVAILVYFVVRQLVPIIDYGIHVGFWRTTGLLDIIPFIDFAFLVFFVFCVAVFIYYVVEIYR